MQWHRQLTWNPRSLDWRVAILFMVGATLFSLGSFPAYGQLVDPGIVGATFFIGSAFFTAAAYSQFLQVANPRDEHGQARRPERFRFWSWEPSRTLWWAAVVQLVGTLFFNIDTFRAMSDSISAAETNRLVWAPDFFGSIAFLVASHLAWLIVCGGIWCVQRNNSDWWIAVLNYVGSIFFMLSAIAAFTLPTTGEEVNVTLVNAATLSGALCFLFGAYLLLPPAHASTSPKTA